MTEAEALEVLSDIGDNVATYFAMYISITFAYLSVAYFIGAALSRFQCIAVSILFVVSALAVGATTIGWANAWLLLKAQERTLVNDVWLFETPGIFPMVIFLLTGMAMLSLYFMYDIRRGSRVTGRE
ncbi:MAG: hypothetical protein ACU84Q_01470 [Gammaproteobacteria bacterium]